MFPRIRLHILTRCSQYYICLPGRGLSLRQSWKTSPLQGGSPGVHAASSYPVCAPGSRLTTHKRPSIKFICGLVEENSLHTPGSRFTVSQSFYVRGSASEHLPKRQSVHPTLQHPGLINPPTPLHNPTSRSYQPPPTAHSNTGVLSNSSTAHSNTHVLQTPPLHTPTPGSYQTPPIAHSNTRVLQTPVHMHRLSSWHKRTRYIKTWCCSTPASHHCPSAVAIQREVPTRHSCWLLALFVLSATQLSLLAHILLSSPRLRGSVW